MRMAMITEVIGFVLEIWFVVYPEKYIFCKTTKMLNMNTLVITDWSNVHISGRIIQEHPQCYLNSTLVLQHVFIVIGSRLFTMLSWNVGQLTNFLRSAIFSIFTIVKLLW